MANNTELYDTLGISKGATPEEVKKAFRRKAMECHPDKHPGKDAEFKKVNEAYSILTDPDKRRMYDQFGVTNDQGGGMPGGPGGVDLNDILQSMFGGGGGGFPGMGGMPGMHGMPGMPGMGGGGPGGFSFVFMGEDDGPSHDEIFGRRQARECDTINIPVDICDIFYGKTKKVEFELLDQCAKCTGTGAADPSFVMKCLTCNGKGSVTQQMGPFFAQSVRCHNCAGNGSSIKNNKICQTCKGQKTVYNKRGFELKIPKGIPNNHELRMDEKGAYDERIKKNKDILFRFQHEVRQPYEIDVEGNVIYTYKIPIDDLLAGFEKKVMIYNEEYTIQSDHYVNPNKNITVPQMGTFNIKKAKQMDLIIKLVPDYTDSERLIKYNDVLRKIFKKNKDPATTPSSPNTSTGKVISLSK